MISVYFATNRELIDETNIKFGERPHKEGPMFYRVGRAELAKVSDDPDEGYEVRAVHLADEARPSSRAADDGKLGSSEIFDSLRKQMKRDKKHILIFLHGFANTFESTLQRAAQLKEAYLITPADGGQPYEPHMFVFSWPSNGKVQPPWQYFDDRDDAEASGVAMGRALMRLWDFVKSLKESDLCQCRLHIVAHSMGNWALRHAILKFRHELGGAALPRIFENAFLMAADEDEDALEHDNKLGLLTQMARAIYSYYSWADRALGISDVTKFNPDRLGSNGPRTFEGLNRRVLAIDCSKVDDTSFEHGNHQYYRLRSEVIADVRAVLSGHLAADEIPKRLEIEPGRRYRIIP